jgi:hypothetical protein
MVLAWQLVNEAEVKPSAASSVCSANAGTMLRDFAADVGGLVKSIDPNHLVSLGTLGTGQCGAANDDYSLVHSVSAIDLCEYHDYGSPAAPMPGDPYNGLAKRLQQCQVLNKPLFVGETGIVPTDVGGSLGARANAFAAKLDTQFRAGVVGLMAWAWNKDGSTLGDYDIGPGDPLLGVLSEPWPQDDDGDGVASSIDVGTAAFDDAAGTTGKIVDTGGLWTLVGDAPTAGDGVRVRTGPGAGAALIDACGFSTSVVAGSDAVLTCGSIRVGVSSGSVRVVLSPDTYVAVSGGSQATVTSLGDDRFTVDEVSRVGGGSVTVSVEGVTQEVPVGGTTSVAAWDFEGFFAPLRGLQPFETNAGRTLPLKWRLVDSKGQPVASLTFASLDVTEVGCALGSTADLPAEAIHGGLQNLGDGYYQLDWRTPRSYARSCKLVTLGVGDGSLHQIEVRFSR